MRPLVSFVILSHERTLRRQAEDSVDAQTLPRSEWELVVKEGAAYYPDKLPSLVRGATGKYVVPLCYDDEVAPTFAVEHVEAAERYGVPLVYSDIEVIGEDVARLPGGRLRIRLPDFSRDVLRHYCVPWVTCLWDREWCEARGVRYDGEQRYFDWDFPLQLCYAGATYHHLVDRYLFRSRVHAANGSRLLTEHELALPQLRAKWAGKIDLA